MLWSESKTSLVSSGKGGETPYETETTLLLPDRQSVRNGKSVRSLAEGEEEVKGEAKEAKK